MQVHQFHSGSAEGDAITNQMLALRDMLRQAGFASEIFVEHIAAPLARELKPIAQYRGAADNALLVHHSMGFDGFERIVGLPDRKILIYHNITPERFFADEHTRRYIRLGRAQLGLYRPHLAHAIADSNFNRRELLDYGYADVDVMPVQSNLRDFLSWKTDAALQAELSGRTQLVFVGRVVPNKCHEDVIRAFAHYRDAYDADAELTLVGDTGMESYVAGLRELASSLGLEGRVRFTGKVSKERLKAHYAAADLFLCMSEHEGFCVPLLEAMAMGVPVVAYRASAVPETMAGAGLLLDTKAPEVASALIAEVLQDAGLRERLIERQHRRIAQLTETDPHRNLLAAIERVRAERRPAPTLQIQGPFETSYSLAIVNRKLAEALEARGRYDVSLYATEGPGDYTPAAKDLAVHPRARAMWERGRALTHPGVTIRNMFPPRVADAKGMLNFQNFAWEESRVPAAYVAHFNRYLDGIGVTSTFVQEALVASGARLPIRVIGNGVELPADFAAMKAYPLRTNKIFRFLHVSSAFPRKGVDVLLKAYFAAFSAEDDVALVLKSFPNPHNQLAAQLAELRAAHAAPPEVELIEEDLPAEAIAGLYKAASCYVHTARGEGFGLPVAEAMLARLPVLVSPNTGLADFCDERTAVCVPFGMVPSESHVAEAGSLWAEPDAEALTRLLRAMAFEPESLDVAAKVDAAERLIRERYTWEKVAERWERFVADVQARKHRPKVAMVTSWNSRCGLAEYSKFLIEASPDYQFEIYANEGVELLQPEAPGEVQRCWLSRWEGGLGRLIESIEASEAEVVHLQFNFGYFELGELARLIERFQGRRKVLITFHATKDCHVNGLVLSLGDIAASLKRADALIVHQAEDVERLRGFGLEANVRLLPHGNLRFAPQEPGELRRALEIPHSPVLATFGFLLPHKGIRETIQALALLKAQYPDLLFIGACALHFDPSSHAFYEECKAEIRRLGLERNVVLVTDFLELEEAMTLLQAADVTLLPYHPTDESASGAVRFCLAAGRPLLTTRQPIFHEVENCTQQIDSATPEAIAAGLAHLLASPEAREKLVAAMDAQAEATSWERVGQLYDALLREALEAARTARVPAQEALVR